MLNKKIIIIIGVCTAVGLIVWLSFIGIRNAQLKQEVSEPVKTAIEKNSPIVGDDFEIINTREPVSNWVIVTIRSKVIKTDDAMILYYRNDDSSFTKIAGPGTSFSKNTLYTKNVPDAVIRELGVISD